MASILKVSAVVVDQGFIHRRARRCPARCSANGCPAWECRWRWSIEGLGVRAKHAAGRQRCDGKRYGSFMVDILDRGEQSRAVCSAIARACSGKSPETPPDGPPAPRRSKGPNPIGRRAPHPIMPRSQHLEKEVGHMSSEIILETRGLVRSSRASWPSTTSTSRCARHHPRADRSQRGRQDRPVSNLLTKFLEPTRPDPVRRAGHHAEKPAQIARRGVVRSFQISSTFPHMSVLENVRVACSRTLGTSFHSGSRAR